MTKRISIKEVEPNGYKALLALELASKDFDIESKLKELIKIRASQINGCAYCVDMHTDYALKYQETERRLFALPVWHESHLFSEEERIALQLTEEITHISKNGVSDATYRAAIEQFGEKITAQIILLITLINSWNRVAISTKMVYK